MGRVLAVGAFVVSVLMILLFTMPLIALPFADALLERNPLLANVLSILAFILLFGGMLGALTLFNSPFPWRTWLLYGVVYVAALFAVIYLEQMRGRALSSETLSNALFSAFLCGIPIATGFRLLHWSKDQWDRSSTVATA